MEPFELLHRVVAVLEGLSVPYLITGSVAAMAYGEPRLTNDVDIVAALEERHIPELIAAFPPDHFYIDADTIREAIRAHGQFNIIHPESGLKVDMIIRSDTEFNASRFRRVRRIHTAETFEANFASPEDVIIKKMEYYREGGSEKHLRDIAGILKISGEVVDRNYITNWARRMNLVDIWDAVQDRLRGSS